MSGIEVAGIVLGSIPLLISAIEHYHDGVSTIQRWRGFHRDHKILAGSLKREQVKMKNVCEELLRGLVPDSQIDSMIKDPFGAQWYSYKVNAKLRARLHDSLEVFQSAVAEIQTAVTELSRRLGITPQDQEQETKSLFKRELQRAKFAISRNTYSSLVTSIRDGISGLQVLTSQSITLEPERKKGSQVRLLALLRDLSSGLHRAIRGSLSCTCSHILNLELAVPPSDITIYSKSETEKILRQLHLHLALSSFTAVPQAIKQTSEGEEWRGLQFCYMPMEDKEKAKAPQFDFLPAAGQSVPERQRSVFQYSPSYDGAHSSIMTLTHEATANVFNLCLPMHGAGTMGSPAAISNLCTETANADSTAVSRCYGFISDTSPLPVRRYMVYPATWISRTTNSRAAISLQDVWTGGDAVPFMTYFARLKLAVIISSSVLQLYGTPWLSQSFCSANIIFLQRSNDDCLYDRVFLWKNVEEEPLSLGEPTSPLAARSNPAMLSLGLLHVEIFLGRPLAEDDCPAGQRLARKFREAQDLLPRIRIESANYFSAVSRCLEGGLHTRQYDEMQLTEESYAGVVALLKKDMDAVSIAD